MSNVEIEYQERVPIFILNPTYKFISEIMQIKQFLEEESTNKFKEIIIDLSNFFEIDSDTLNRLSDIVKEYGNRINKFGLIIPQEITMEGLKIKLIDDLIEIYGTKYEAIYDLLN